MQYVPQTNINPKNLTGTNQRSSVPKIPGLATRHASCSWRFKVRPIVALRAVFGRRPNAGCNLTNQKYICNSDRTRSTNCRSSSNKSRPAGKKHSRCRWIGRRRGCKSGTGWGGAPYKWRRWSRSPGTFSWIYRRRSRRGRSCSRPPRINKRWRSSFYRTNRSSLRRWRRFCRRGSTLREAARGRSRLGRTTRPRRSYWRETGSEPGIACSCGSWSWSSCSTRSRRPRRRGSCSKGIAPGGSWIGRRSSLFFMGGIVPELK